MGMNVTIPVDGKSLMRALIQTSDAQTQVTVNAQFNPKELQIDKTVSWTAKSGHTEDPAQEFKEPQSRELSCTLYFDGYEQKDDVYDKYVSQLEKMVTMDPQLGRPPVVLFVWGKLTFKGVVESLTQKYTMFLSDGTRVRCEVGFKMKSAESAAVSTKTT